MRVARAGAHQAGRRYPATARRGRSLRAGRSAKGHCRTRSPPLIDPRAALTCDFVACLPANFFPPCPTSTPNLNHDARPMRGSGGSANVETCQERHRIDKSESVKPVSTCRQAGPSNKRSMSDGKPCKCFFNYFVRWGRTRVLRACLSY